MPIDERRRAPRLPVELSVAFRDLGRPEESHADLVRNISAGGVFIETSVGLPVGTAVAVGIQLDPRGRSIELEGEVVRVEWQSGTTGSRSERRVQGLAVLFRPGQPAVVTLLERCRAAPEAPAPREGSLT